jgi:hypothetical protein
MNIFTGPGGYQTQTMHYFPIFNEYLVVETILNIHVFSLPEIIPT